MGGDEEADDDTATGEVRTTEVHPAEGDGADRHSAVGEEEGRCPGSYAGGHPGVAPRGIVREGG